jgi:hypothetical protein
MAYVPLVPVSLNATMQQALAQNFQSPVINSPSGSPINLSAWVDLTATINALNPSPNTADATFGTVTGASTGIITLTTSATDLASVPAGSANLIISGKPTSGDSLQVLCTGVLNLKTS